MKTLNVIFETGLIGIIGLLVYLIANDYWLYHPEYRIKKIAYVIRQVVSLLGYVYGLSLMLLEIITLILFVNS